MISLSARLETKDLEAGLDRLDDELAALLPQALKLGGQIVAAEARRTTEFKDRSTALRMSIQEGDVARVGGGFEIQVSAGETYGAYLEFGTRDHLVMPTKAKALRWATPQGFAFSRGHVVKGIKPMEFMADALEREGDKVEQVIVDAVQLAIQRAGF